MPYAASANCDHIPPTTRALIQPGMAVRDVGYCQRIQAAVEEQRVDNDAHVGPIEGNLDLRGVAWGEWQWIWFRDAAASQFQLRQIPKTGVLHHAQKRAS